MWFTSDCVLEVILAWIRRCSSSKQFFRVETGTSTGLRRGNRLGGNPLLLDGPLRILLVPSLGPLLSTYPR